jgi:hypothetical protein
MTPKTCAKLPESREPTLDAMDDIAIIAQILRALGSGPDDVKAAVVYWLGKRLNAAAERLEDHQD